MTLEQTGLYCLPGFLQQDPYGCGSGFKLMRMQCDCVGKEDAGTEQGAKERASGKR